MNKTVLYILLGTIASCAVLLAARQYYIPSPPATPAKGFTEHITAYTSGTISNASSITIVLSSAPKKQLDKQALERLFSFSPAIPGTVTWADECTLTFKPNKPLPSNKQYKAKFYLSHLKNVAPEFNTFSFQFQTLAQALHVDVVGLQTPDPSVPAAMQLKGSLTTADWAVDDRIEQVLSVTQHGKQLPIQWQHQPASKSHTFTITNILRAQHAVDKVTIKWKGTPIDASQEGQQVVNVPALGEFQVTDAYRSATASCLAIHFSDPIDNNQELDGLIYLQNETTGKQLSIRLVVASNLVYAYTKQSPPGNYKLVVEEGIKSTLGNTLAKRFEKIIVYESIKPAVQLVGEGVILPSSAGLLLPFKAVGLSGVIVKIVQIPTNNTPQFLQINQLDQNKELKRVGRLIYKNKIALNKEVDFRQWNTFSIDLSQLIKVEPGAFYRVYLSFDRSQVVSCTCTDPTKPKDTVASVHENEAADPEIAYFDDPDDASYDWDSSYRAYRYEGRYCWEERNDPCKPSYYLLGNHILQRNVFASDLGIIAKRGANKELFVAVSNLGTAQPLENVELKAYNFQHQLVGQGRTNSKGMAQIALAGGPFLLIAQQGKQIGYLQLNANNACSLSMFDVDGQKTQQGGLKGFIYGERGVWRPGDTLYLSFILEDKQHTLPTNHPIIFELYTPHNQLHTKQVVTEGLNGFYSFTPTTEQDAPTGNWLAKVSVGGAVFTKSVKIETIKPNRLKAALHYDQALLNQGILQGTVAAQWLHGALAKDLQTDVQLKLAPTTTTFEDYPDYTFDDPAKTLHSTEKEIFKGTLDQQGKGRFNIPMTLDDTPPGMVKATVNIRVFEKGGDFSVERTSLHYSPYKGYVGFRLPPGDGYNNALFSDKENLIPIVTVDKQGRPAARKNVKIEVFALQWRWWFDRSATDDLAAYLQNNSTCRIHTDYIDTPAGKATYTLNLGTQSWGRKYIRITDPETNHSAGQIFYTDYTDYGEANRKNPSGAEMLTFKTDKAQYQVGEQVTVALPATNQGKALVSIESGAKILDTFWVPVTPKKHHFHFTATAAMAPNVYVHITYVQPHKQRGNDLPIRLYGVQPVKVEDPTTHLQPVVTMPQTLAPEEEITIQVHEKQGKKMTYTLAMVDEGLLGITNFKTPKPWEHFYAREALGVKTWDMYQYVVGAFTGAMSGLRAIGGDEASLGSNTGGKKANRFKPVVTYLGPIELQPGHQQTHTLKMPQYIGAVKTMVVAGHEGAYGTCTQTTPVKKPLMVVATLPRVVGPQENIKMPVTVFAMDEHIQEATVTIAPNSYFEVVGSNQKKITFPSSSEQIVTFDLAVRKKIGMGKVHITAQSGKEKATYDIELDVRLPNPRITHTVDAVIAPGKTWETTYQPVGLPGTNQGIIEIASIPPINLANRLQYLLQYPHGCVEQVTSAVFPQLFLATLMELTTEQRQQIQANVMAGLQKLKNFQTHTGGLSYWPGVYEKTNAWGTNYAGHFMLAAQSVGYSLPVGLLEGWIKHQQQAANQWTASPGTHFDSQPSHQRIQAYRLYTLALAGKPAMGAMNRLRAMNDLSVTAQWLLAGAYQLAGQPEAAQALVSDLTTQVPSYQELAGSYGSSIRDQAMILHMLQLLKQRSQAHKVAESLAKELNSESWLSTQTTAYALLALAQFIGHEQATKGIQGTCSFAQGPEENFSTTASITQIPLPIKAAQPGQVALTNTGNVPLFVKVQLNGIPLTATAPAEEKNLKLHIDYLDMAGNRIDPAKLPQATDFIAEVHVHHPGIQADYRAMALMHHFPAGWEIKNERLDEASASQGAATYQDIRDDRVYTYFDLKKHETKTFRLLLNATYIGRYYLPTVACEAMYDASIHAQCNGQWVEVISN